MPNPILEGWQCLQMDGVGEQIKGDNRGQGGNNNNEDSAGKRVGK